MTKVERIEVEETYKKITSSQALLVCAYDEDATFRTMRLEGAISLKEFESRLPSISKERETIFYCS